MRTEPPQPSSGSSGWWRTTAGSSRSIGTSASSTTGYNYLIQLVPILIAAPLFIEREAEFGVIGQSTMAFCTMVTALSPIVTQIQSISAYARGPASGWASSPTTPRGDGETAAGCVGLHVRGGRFRVSRRDAAVASGRGRGAGREARTDDREGGPSADLREPRGAAGAVPGGGGVAGDRHGSVIRPPEKSVAYIPENSFLPVATLRDMLIAPDDKTTTDEEMWTVLRQLGLDTAIRRRRRRRFCGTGTDLLARKQEQLVAVARAILARPDFVLIDNLDSSLDGVTERRVLKLLKRRGITSVSFSDQLPTVEFHDRSLELGDGGTWQLTESDAGAGGGEGHGLKSPGSRAGRPGQPERSCEERCKRRWTWQGKERSSNNPRQVTRLHRAFPEFPKSPLQEAATAGHRRLGLSELRLSLQHASQLFC